MNAKKEELPAIVIDARNGCQYRRGKFLGKGGFARCYELQDMDTNELFAGKVVSKSLLQKAHHREKMQMEIAVHRLLSHRNIVKFISSFEDADNVYIILELCNRRSLMELHKRRNTVTSPEARYFLRQIVLAVKYLHDSQVIHRDLKLGNLFLNDDMEVKIGDFGLAARIERDGERKLTLCGTPNYIAPEVLCQRGHSFEVDAWSIGCILYTLLSGKPPFETTTLKETYHRIKRNAYSINPHSLLAQTPHAADLVRLLLSPNPRDRPCMAAVLEHPFFTGFIPTALPVSCLSTAPRFDTIPRLNDVKVNEFPSPSVVSNQFNLPSCSASGASTSNARRPLDTIPMNAAIDAACAALVTRSCPVMSNACMETDCDAASAKDSDRLPPSANTQTDDGPANLAESPDCGLSVLRRQVRLCVAAVENKLVLHDDSLSHVPDEMIEDPACAPIYWISKWVDYSDKYGLGYQLCDNSVGVLFNDSTRLSLASNGRNMQYFDRNGAEELHTLNAFPASLQRKVTLLRYFNSYMNENLMRAGGDRLPREADGMTRLPFMKSWFRTRTAIVMLLSNGTLQINFLEDHVKIILCPVMEAVTVLDTDHTFHTYRFQLIHEHGAPAILSQKLRYVQQMINKLTTRIAAQNAALNALYGAGNAAAANAACAESNNANELTPTQSYQAAASANRN